MLVVVVSYLCSLGERVEHSVVVSYPAVLLYIPFSSFTLSCS